MVDFRRREPGDLYRRVQQDQFFKLILEGAVRDPTGRRPCFWCRDTTCSLLYHGPLMAEPQFAFQRAREGEEPRLTAKGANHLDAEAERPGSLRGWD